MLGLDINDLETLSLMPKITLILLTTLRTLIITPMILTNRNIQYNTLFFYESKNPSYDNNNNSMNLMTLNLLIIVNKMQPMLHLPSIKSS